MSTSFLVAGGVGVVANYAFFSQYTPVSMDLLLKEMSTVVQPLSALKTLLPALFGFLGGTFLLLVWNYLRVRVVRFLLQYDGWFLHPKRRINKLWYLLMVILVGTKNRGIGGYKDFLPSLPVPPLEKTAKRYLDSVRPLLTSEEYQETKAAVKQFVKHDGVKLQWLLKFRSWRMRNWIADWWVDFIYLRQRTPICFNSNYYALCARHSPTTSQLDRAANVIYHWATFYTKGVLLGKVESAMAGQVAPFDNSCYKYLCATTRIPGEEKDELVYYQKDKPTHGIVYRLGKYYLIEVISPVTGKVHSPLTLRKQLEKVMAMAGDVHDGTGVQNLTALPRTKWAQIRKMMLKNTVNRRSLNLIGSALTSIVLDTESVEMDKDLTAVANLMFHGSRWYDKMVNIMVTPNGVIGANVEHAPLDATVCLQLWEYMMSLETYDSNGRCTELYPGEKPLDTPNPSVLRWEVDDIKDHLSEAATHLTSMINNSDLVTVSSYGKSLPKKLKLSPDGWIQMALQLTYYRLHKKVVLTYESATTRLYYQGRTETIRPVSDDSVAFIKAFDDPASSKEEVKELLKRAIEYQYAYKMEAMRGMGVDRHLFGLYVIAKGLNLNPMPKMFTDKAFNFSFILSTSQTPVKVTHRWTLEKSTSLGGFGTVCEEGYGISYIVVGEDEVNYSIHSKRSCEETSSEMFSQCLLKTLEDMKALYNV